MTETGTVRIAPPYDENLIRKLEAGFSRLLDRPVDLTAEEDPALLGGFVAYVDGKVYDASMQTGLTDLLQALED